MKYEYISGFVFFILLIIMSIISAQTTGKFTVTSNVAEDSQNCSNSSQVKADYCKENEQGFFQAIKNFFKKIFEFFIK